MRIRHFALCALGMVAVAGSAQAELIVNGGFETGNFNGWTMSGYIASSGVAAGAAYSGSNGARFGATAPAFNKISQTIATDIGTHYQLTFDLWVAGKPNQFDTTINNVSIMSITNSVGIVESTWAHETLTFTADSPMTAVGFSFSNDPNSWRIDNISVPSVPEPTCLALIGVTAGLLMSRRRRAV